MIGKHTSGSRIPDKHFYTIGDASQLTGVKAHILRYWESQFKVLRPQRRYSGHRKYTNEEIDLINKIRYLVLERKFTLKGASREINRQLNRKIGDSETPINSAGPDLNKSLRDLKKEVGECLQLLGSNPSTRQELV
jgi:DNA-binding transcriptional MerR regulator